MQLFLFPLHVGQQFFVCSDSFRSKQVGFYVDTNSGYQALCLSYSSLGLSLQTCGSMPHSHTHSHQYSLKFDMHTAPSQNHIYSPKPLRVRARSPVCFLFCVFVFSCRALQQTNIQCVKNAMCRPPYLSGLCSKQQPQQKSQLSTQQRSW